MKWNWYIEREKNSPLTGNRLWKFHNRWTQRTDDVCITWNVNLSSHRYFLLINSEFFIVSQNILVSINMWIKLQSLTSCGWAVALILTLESHHLKWQKKNIQKIATVFNHLILLRLMIEKIIIRFKCRKILNNIFF